MMASINEWIMAANRPSMLQVFYFRVLLCLMGFAQYLMFYVNRYLVSRSGEFFVHSPTPFFNHVPVYLHKGPFWMGFFCLFPILLNRSSAFICSIMVSLSMAYYTMSDLFGFHHDIFLAANLFFLFSFFLYFDSRGGESKQKEIYKAYSIFAIKILICAVYFFAGLHKLTPEFLTGDLLNQVLEAPMFQRWGLGFLSSFSRYLAWMTAILEFSMPLILFTPKLRKPGLLFATVFHFVIGTFGGRGALFNIYLPVTFILFLDHPKDPVCLRKERSRLVVNRFSLNPGFWLSLFSYFYYVKMWIRLL